jgi:thioredoxin-like negative regulator of GroEL
MLGVAPAAVRPELLKQLHADGSPNARQLEANLRARWGDPLTGFQALAATLSEDRAGAVEALRVFIDQLRGQPGPPAKRAEALALEALSERVVGAEGARLRLQAAQSFADGGDQASARRMLTGVAGDSTAPQGIASGATTTLIGVLLSEGKVDEADRKLAELQGSLPSDDWLALRRRVAWGWVRGGQLGRAESTLAADTSAEGLALAGRLRLLHGDVRGASEHLAAAGPYAGTRDDATGRTTLLALLQPIEADSLPALGAALLKAEQGDTAAAIIGLEQVAAGLPPGKGGAELRLHAGTLARLAGRTAEAERLFRAADMPEAKAAAPAAELALGQLLIDLNRGGEAVKVLEQLILSHPESALVPQARRALDEARGAVPPT